MIPDILLYIKDSDATKARKAEVEPDDFIQVKPKKLKTSLPEISGYNEDADSGPYYYNMHKTQLAHDRQTDIYLI